jgi:hypothetical protein
MNTPLRRQKGQAFASWLLGSVFGLFLMCVYLFQGHEVSPEQHKILGIFGALTGAAFSFFFSGDIGLNLNFSVKDLGGICVRAVGGVAVFIFVLWWWDSPYNHITEQEIFVHQEVKTFISQLDAEFQNFETKLSEEVVGKQDDTAVLLAQKKSLLAASEALKDKIEQYLHSKKLNRPEREFVLAALEKNNEYASAREDEIALLKKQNESDSFTPPINAHTNADLANPPPSIEETNDVTEEALNKFGLSRSNVVKIQVRSFIFDGLFPERIIISYGPESASTAHKLEDELVKHHARNIILTENPVPPTSPLSEKITFETNSFDNINLSSAQNIRNVIRNIDSDLGNKLQIVDRSVIMPNLENADLATVIVYLP